jgi:hypothetical protein
MLMSFIRIVLACYQKVLPSLVNAAFGASYPFAPFLEAWCNIARGGVLA